MRVHLSVRFLLEVIHDVVIMCTTEKLSPLLEFLPILSIDNLWHGSIIHLIGVVLPRLPLVHQIININFTLNLASSLTMSFVLTLRPIRNLSLYSINLFAISQRGITLTISRELTLSLILIHNSQGILHFRCLMTMILFCLSLLG